MRWLRKLVKAEEAHAKEQPLDQKLFWRYLAAKQRLHVTRYPPASHTASAAASGSSRPYLAPTDPFPGTRSALPPSYPPAHPHQGLPCACMRERLLGVRAHAALA